MLARPVRTRNAFGNRLNDGADQVIPPLHSHNARTKAGKWARTVPNSARSYFNSRCSILLPLTMGSSGVSHVCRTATELDKEESYDLASAKPWPAR